MVIWGARERVRRAGVYAPVALGVLAVAGCLVATPLQARYWKNSETLYRHAVETTEGNGMMESGLGRILLEEGRVDESLPHLQKAVAANADLPNAHYCLGSALLAKRRVAEALAEFEIAVHLQPDNPLAQFKLGSVLLELGRAGDALSPLQKAVDLFPLAAGGGDSLYGLAIRPDTKFTPLMGEAHYNLGNALLQLGRTREAIAQYEEALQIVPDFIPATHTLAWVLAANPDASLRNGARAVELARRANELSGGRNPMMLGTLGVAYAETGKFGDAIAAVQRALQIAGGAGNATLGNLLRSELALYQAGLPFRDTALAAPVSSPRTP